PRIPFPKTILTLCTLSLCLLCIEAYLHVLHKEDPPQGYSLSFYTHRGDRISTLDGALHLAISPFTLYKNLPNQKTETFTVNSMGFRGPEVFITPDQRERVIVVGGSAAFGLGAKNDSETFIAQAQALSDEYEWINAGVCGFLSGQELTYIVTELVDYQPDIIVSYDGWNDFFGAWFFANCLRDRKRKDELGANLFVLGQIETELLGNYNTQVNLTDSAGRFIGTLLDKSAIISTFRERKPEEIDRILRPGRTTENSMQSDADYLEDAVRSCTTNIKKMRDFCRSQGIDFLAVLQPDLGLKTNTTPEEKRLLLNMESFIQHYMEEYRNDFPALYGRFLESVKAVLAREEIEFIDISEDRRFSSCEETTFEDTVHTNRAGNEIIAGIIHEKITRHESLH
ncbi:MAG: hypothetical protein ABIH23_11645, partial [bacterium]